MSRAMIQAAVTMNQLQNKLDLIGHNLSNSETTGYKSRETEFSSLLFQQINNMTQQGNASERVTPDGIRIGSGAKLGSINNDLSLGTVSETDRELDVALLEENQLFQIEVTEAGTTETRYTRDGSFYLSPSPDNESLLLTTADGHPVLGKNGPITIAAGFDGVSVQSNGQITVQRGNLIEEADRLAIVEAVRPRLLEATGQNLFRLPDIEDLGFNITEIIQDVGQATILKSGALENSNVNTSKQMTDMILAQRSYQFNARTISMGDQMLGLINQLR